MVYEVGYGFYFFEVVVDIVFVIKNVFVLCDVYFKEFLIVLFKLILSDKLIVVVDEIRLILKY